MQAKKPDLNSLVAFQTRQHSTGFIRVPGFHPAEASAVTTPVPGPFDRANVYAAGVL